MAQPAVKKYSKQWIVACNVAISMIVVICVASGAGVIFAYRPPKKLQEKEGIIAKFAQHDKEWYDYIGSGGGAYFRVTLDDGTYFEATGICYDNINRDLFKTISVGDEINITYSSQYGPNRIFAIEYGGVNYLSSDDVLSGYEDTAKIATVIGAVIIALSVAIGGVCLFMVNYKYRKKKAQNV